MHFKTTKLYLIAFIKFIFTLSAILSFLVYTLTGMLYYVVYKYFTTVDDLFKYPDLVKTLLVITVTIVMVVLDVIVFKDVSLDEYNDILRILKHNEIIKYNDELINYYNDYVYSINTVENTKTKRVYVSDEILALQSYELYIYGVIEVVYDPKRKGKDVGTTPKGAIVNKVDKFFEYNE